MNWTKNAAVAALLIASATPAVAQQPDRVERRGFGGGVESVLRMRESLKLSDAQLNQLEALRKEIVVRRQNEARDMIDLQSRIAAGQIESDEARKQMENRREAMRGTMDQTRERLEKILSAEQREELQAQLKERRGKRGERFREPPIRGRYRWN